MWNIPFTEFSDVNLANVKSITIGFGDGNAPYSNTGEGRVYFDDIILGNGNAEEPSNDDDGSVYLDEDPFVYGYDGYPLFLKQGCPLIGAGCGYIDEYPYLIGKTTSEYWFPDTNMVNIGFHYFFNWDYLYGNTLNSDLYKDMIVNFKDFAILADGWLTIYDINDLITMADQWLRTATANPPIAVTISGDPNNLTGDVSIGINGYDTTTERVFVLMDGEFVGEIVDFDDEGCVGLDSRVYDNGQHTIKVVAVDTNGLITVSENATVNFTNELHCIKGEGDFEEGRDYNIFAMCSSGQNLRVKVIDWNDTVVWTSPIISGNINLAIPESVFSGQLYDLVIEKESESYALMAEGEGESWESIWAKSIVKPYQPSTSYRFAIFLPSVWGFAFPNPIPFNSANTRKKTVAEIVRVCEGKEMPYVVLYEGQCTWENFASVLSSPGINYVYMVTHGGFKNYGSPENEEYRTHFWLTGSTKVISRPSSYIKESSSIHYMDSIGLGTIKRIRIAHIDACFQTRHDDMANAWIDELLGNVDQLFISWQGEVILTNDDWDIWGRDVWRGLGDGDNYDTAKENALKNNDSSHLIESNIGEIGWDQVTFTSEGN